MTAFPCPSSPPVLPDERLAAGATRPAARHVGRFSGKAVQGLLDAWCLRPAHTARVRTHLVVQALRAAGVEPGGAFPKPLTDEVVRAADIAVTMRGTPARWRPAAAAWTGPLPTPTAPRSPWCGPSGDINGRLTDLPAAFPAR